LGCRLTVTHQNEEIQAVAGNVCPRGISYAKQEFLCPLRVLTTLIRVEGTDRPLPVRSDRPVPLSQLFACKEYLNCIEAVAPIRCGDILVTNICNTGSNIAATADFDLKM
jgi:CxxC motif-containing protein